jgi:nitrite reductase/ring-hydroxylating ferredoxin subunit
LGQTNQIQRENNMVDIERRRFLTGTGKVIVGTACGCSLLSCKMISGVGDAPELPPSLYRIEDGELSIALDGIPELSGIGGSVKITTSRLSDPLIIARVSEREYVAASLRCTHWEREVEYLPEEKKFRCVSLGHSEFSTNGSLLKGPAEKPLRVYEVSPGGTGENRLTIVLS